MWQRISTLQSSLQRLDGVNLIICHEEAIAFDISTEDGSELSGNLVVVGHVVRSPSSGFCVSEDDTDEIVLRFQQCTGWLGLGQVWNKQKEYDSILC